MITKMLTEFSSAIANNQLEKMKESDPTQYDQTLKLFITAAEVGIHFLKENPEFREVFAQIHNEFLNYPESKSTIEKALHTAKSFDLAKTEALKTSPE